MNSTEFSEVVKVNQQSEYYFVRRMILDHDDANDVVQNTFLKAWKGIDKFKGESKISTWLMRIAYNESINFINSRKNISGIGLDDIESKLPTILQQDQFYNGDEIQSILQAAIATLPEKQKAVFIMKYYKDMKYKAISEVTGTSIGALKASYHIAVKKIEEFLNGY